MGGQGITLGPARSQQRGMIATRPAGPDQLQHYRDRAPVSGGDDRPHPAGWTSLE